MKYFAAALFAALMVACPAVARAATEFCPAHLAGNPAPSPAGPATTYHYRLQALGPRTVEGTIVADTDAGWFTWTQPAVQLTRTTYTNSSASVQYEFHVADSPELSVNFPQSVEIRHAWITTASTHGDPYFGWDAQGTVQCAPPDFTAFAGNGPHSKRTPLATDPAPAPAPPAATAVAISVPFPIPTCANPFTAATVTAPVRPDFPESVRDQGFAGSAVTVIAVAIGPDGKLLDAWVLAPSGYPALDRAALLAARHSQYAVPTSYCTAVSGTYLFMASFSTP